MRLTLRTLLAYLDDTLEPAQARLIGQKVAESDAAQEIIARIKQVTRRRRLTTPPASGPGARLEANTLAEYLDNELPGEQLAVVEETCLGSDAHLAEVAACHQILTLVLGEPAMVPPTARQRMYGLIQGREAIPYRKPPAVRTAASHADRASLSGDEADEALLLGLPLHQLRSGWVIPAAALLLLAASAGALWMALRPPRLAQVAQAPAADHELLPPPKNEGEPDVPTAEKPAPEVKPPPKPEPEPDKKTDAGSKPAIDAKPEKPTGPQPPSDKRVEVGRYVYVENQPGVLLRATREEATPWQRLAPESRVATAEYLVSLPGYRGEVRLDSRVHLQLWGNLPEFSPTLVRESAVTLHENSEFDLDFTLERGRVVFSNHKTEGEARVRARFLEEVWDVTLHDGRSVVAIELVSAYDQGVPFSRKPGPENRPTSEVAVLILEGQAGLKVRHRHFGSLQSPQLFLWETDLAQAPNPIPLPRVPEWWASKAPAASAFAKDMQAALNELADRLTAKVSLDVALTEARRNPRPASRVLAVRCYAAINDLDRLLDALTDEQNDDVRIAAADALQVWSGLRADHDLRLFALLSAKGISEAHAEIIMKLLHTYSQAEIDSPETYEALIEYLRHERLPIRELAYRQLRFLAPEGVKKVPYHPTASAAERERAYEQWKKLIPTGKLPAQTKPAPGKGP